MPKNLSLLDRVRVASPCPASWENMTGDDRSRFCGQCNLHVYNLSDMTRDEAESLLRQREGRLCVRYYQRADGTILTRDCPVGLRAVRIRLVKTLGAVAAVVGLLFSALTALGRGRDTTSSARLSRLQPFSAIRAKLAPTVATFAPRNPPAIMGSLVGYVDSAALDEIDVLKAPDSQKSHNVAPDPPRRPTRLWQDKSRQKERRNAR
ncbi:MAG: hypothetical protein FLDDKLPJ_00885 [Phycisphaerae bacterium]|nr:hypothetical protein [Phycisphaerae bacterium]